MKTTILMNKRDRWEQRIRTADLQEKGAWANFHRFQDEKKSIVVRYENWLKENKMEPLINLSQYK